MAERIELFEVTAPAGTAIATPVTQNLSMDQGVIERIEVTVPVGPSGFMGFRFRHSSQVVIPYKGANWVIVNGVDLSWPVAGYPVGNAWSVQMYNTDIYDHTIYIRMHVNEIPDRPQALPAIIAIE